MRAIDPQVYATLQILERGRIKAWLKEMEIPFDQCHLIADSDEHGFSMVCYYNINADGQRYLATENQASQRCILTKTPDWLEAIYETL